MSHNFGRILLDDRTTTNDSREKKKCLQVIKVIYVSLIISGMHRGGICNKGTRIVYKY